MPVKKQFGTQSVKVFLVSCGTWFKKGFHILLHFPSPPLRTTGSLWRGSIRSTVFHCNNCSIHLNNMRFLADNNHFEKLFYFLCTAEQKFSRNSTNCVTSQCTQNHIWISIKVNWWDNVSEACCEAWRTVSNTIIKVSVELILSSAQSRDFGHKVVLSIFSEYRLSCKSQGALVKHCCRELQTH